MLSALLGHSKELARVISRSTLVTYTKVYAPRVVAHQLAVRSMSTTQAAKQNHKIPFPQVRTEKPSLDERIHAFDHARFGELDHTDLGPLSLVPESNIQWPTNHRLVCTSCKGHLLTYRMCDVDKEADRIAEIYQAALDELHGNSSSDWHHSPEAIRQRVNEGNFSLWGVYDNGHKDELIGVISAEKIPGERRVHIGWGAVHPEFRGRGTFESIGMFVDGIIEKSGAQYGTIWVPTTHNLGQRMMEQVPGWKPVGFFRGGAFMGGHDERFYRENVVWYDKLFNGKSVNHGTGRILI